VYGIFVDQTQEPVMSKGQKRSNREAKKPKQAKSEKKPLSATLLPAPERTTKGTKKA
jgi:hypothetical protein